MRTKNITLNQKAKWTPIILERDYPNAEEPYCFFCEQRFIEHDPRWCQEWEHLNNNDDDNRPENMVWAHAQCNEKKKYNAEWQVLAADKLKKNVKFHSDLLRESERERSFSAHKETSDEADVSAVIVQHAIQFLAQELLPQQGNEPKRKQLPLKEAVECVDYLVKKDTNGRGSHPSVQRHLESLTCTISKEYERRTIKGKWIIFRREGQ